LTISFERWEFDSHHDATGMAERLESEADEVLPVLDRCAKLMDQAGR